MMNYAKAKDKKILSLLPKLEGEDKILDIGCEYGGVTALFQRKKYLVEGIDIDPKVIKIAKDKYPYVNFSVGDLYKVDFSKYKVFFLWGVFEYVLDLESFLKKVKKEMKKDSYIIFGVPNICSLSKRARCFFGTNPNRDVDCFKTYTFKQIKKIIKSVEFGKSEITSTNRDCLKNFCFPTPKTLSTDIIVKLQK